MTTVNFKKSVIALAIGVFVESCGGSGNRLQQAATTEMKVETQAEPVTPQRDEKLVLPNGQAWVMQDITTSGYIFKLDGTYGYYDGSWQLQSDGTWSTNGNTLTIVQTGISPNNVTYSVSDGKFTITTRFGDVYVYNQMPVP